MKLRLKYNALCIIANDVMGSHLDFFDETADPVFRTVFQLTRDVILKDKQPYILEPNIEQILKPL